MLIYIVLWCDELISQLVTPWLLWPFLILVDLYVMSCKINSSHCNILIISELGGFVMSDEFLTKLFTVLRINRITYSAKSCALVLQKAVFQDTKHTFCDAVCRLLYFIYGIFLFASAVITFGLDVIIRHLFNSCQLGLTFNRKCK